MKLAVNLKRTEREREMEGVGLGKGRSAELLSFFVPLYQTVEDDALHAFAVHIERTDLHVTPDGVQVHNLGSILEIDFECQDGAKP